MVASSDHAQREVERKGYVIVHLEVRAKEKGG